MVTVPKPEPVLATVSTVFSAFRSNVATTLTLPGSAVSTPDASARDQVGQFACFKQIEAFEDFEADDMGAGVGVSLEEDGFDFRYFYFFDKRGCAGAGFGAGRCIAAFDRREPCQERPSK